MILSFLIKCRTIPILGRIFKFLLLVCGLDLPPEVRLGKNVHFPHNSIGTVIHLNTIIEDDVIIFHNVTVGRADVMTLASETKFKDITICKGAILCAGAKIISNEEHLVIGSKAVVAANAVLTHSIGANEIWGGVPARFLKMRE